MVSLYMGEYPDGRQGSRLLLTQALRDWGASPEEPCHNEAGKPFLPDGPELSISHTRGAAAVALGTGALGVDVERRRPVRDGVAQRVLSGAEYAWYEARGQCPEDFLVLWTLKESYYKYLGTGLPGYPNETEFRMKNGVWQLMGRPQRFFTWQKKDLLIALCCDEQETEIMMHFGS